MSIYGLLKVTDLETKIAALPQRELLDATNIYLERHNLAWNRAEGIFVEEITEQFKFNYQGIGGGFMQRRGGQSRTAVVKPTGGWNVEIPLEGFGDDLGIERDLFPYLTMKGWQRVIDNLRIRSMNSRRLEMMRALYVNTARPFKDKWAGDLTIQPLAITSDGVIYPPGVGQNAGATAQMYLTSDTYDEAGISNTNNPYAVHRAKLGVWNPSPNRLVTFINSAQQTLTEALAGFVAVPDLIGVAYGDDKDKAIYPSDAPDLPGTLIGRLDGQWISVWDAGVPARYIVTRDLDAPAPLYRRRHLASTGIGDGLRLVSESDVEPVKLATYEDDFGYGVVNRIGAVITELTLDAVYDIPTLYAS